MRQWLIDCYGRSSKQLWNACEERFGLRVADTPEQFKVLLGRLYLMWRSLRGAGQAALATENRATMTEKTVNGHRELVTIDLWDVLTEEEQKRHTGNVLKCDWCDQRKCKAFWKRNFKPGEWKAAHPTTTFSEGTLYVKTGGKGQYCALLPRRLKLSTGKKTKAQLTAFIEKLEAEYKRALGETFDLIRQLAKLPTIRAVVEELGLRRVQEGKKVIDKTMDRRMKKKVTQIRKEHAAVLDERNTTVLMNTDLSQRARREC